MSTHKYKREGYKGLIEDSKYFSSKNKKYRTYLTTFGTISLQEIYTNWSTGRNFNVTIRASIPGTATFQEVFTSWHFFWTYIVR